MKLIDEYLYNGWKVIPIYPRTKVPIGNDWYNNWTSEKVTDAYVSNPNCNWGLLLGEIVDIEGDTLAANDLLCELTKDIPHPTFRSSKSIHHLFSNTNTQMTGFKLNNIEFRGYKHQSIIPPSIHPDGSPYRWINHSYDCPPIPSVLLEFYNNHCKKPNKVKFSIKKGHCLAWCCECLVKFPMHRKRFSIEKLAFSQLNLKWACQKCRHVNLRSICKKLRRSLV